MGAIRRKSFGDPDGLREFPLLTVGLADGNDLAFESRGAREVKGLDRPIEVYRLA